MSARMARANGRSNDWGFPRWRSYGGERGAATVRTCDREGCGEVGDRPAPKSPNPAPDPNPKPLTLDSR